MARCPSTRTLNMRFSLCFPAVLALMAAASPVPDTPSVTVDQPTTSTAVVPSCDGNADGAGTSVPPVDTSATAAGGQLSTSVAGGQPSASAAGGDPATSVAAGQSSGVKASQTATSAVANPSSSSVSTGNDSGKKRYVAYWSM